MKILLLGSNGQLGCELGRWLPNVGVVEELSRDSGDIADMNFISRSIKRIKPDIIVNAAAYTSVDKAEKDKTQAFEVNAKAVANLARLAKSEAAWFIHFSTDYVFDGNKKAPYLETDETNPINVYGQSKLAGEKEIINSSCQSLIFRTSWIIGKDGNNFAKTILKLAGQKQSLSVVSDQVGVPTSSSLIARVVLDAISAIEKGRSWNSGLYHISPKGASNWNEIARILLEFAQRHKFPLKLCAENVRAISSAENSIKASRPLNSLLDTQKLRSKLSFELPDWKDDFLAVASDILKELKPK
ncbi:dTDP-4-dehydrorhamnose reductase [Alphaproteobacteria bacterium]|nr:dTDP-4-dehydrorhamnose reductase [Alphaproteobacteria bacterium]